MSSPTDERALREKVAAEIDNYIGDISTSRTMADAILAILPPASEQAEPSEDVKVMREALEKIASVPYGMSALCGGIARQAIAACKDTSHE